MNLSYWITGEGKWLSLTIFFFLFDVVGSYIALTYFPDYFLEMAPVAYFLITNYGLAITFLVIAPISAIVGFLVIGHFWQNRKFRIAIYILCAIKFLQILWNVVVVLRVIYV